MSTVGSVIESMVAKYMWSTRAQFHFRTIVAGTIVAEFPELCESARRDKQLNRKRGQLFAIFAVFAIFALIKSCIFIYCPPDNAFCKQMSMP